MKELTEAGVYDVVPDVIAWNSVIGAIAHSDDPTPAQQAQAMVDRMQNFYPAVKGNGRLLRPVGITYSYVIEAWLKRG